MELLSFLKQQRRTITVVPKLYAESMEYLETQIFLISSLTHNTITISDTYRNVLPT